MVGYILDIMMVLTLRGSKKAALLVGVRKSGDHLKNITYVAKHHRFHQCFYEMSEIQFPFYVVKSDILALIAFSSLAWLPCYFLKVKKPFKREECHFGYLIYYSRP